MHAEVASPPMAKGACIGGQVFGKDAEQRPYHGSAIAPINYETLESAVTRARQTSPSHECRVGSGFMLRFGDRGGDGAVHRRNAPEAIWTKAWRSRLGIAVGCDVEIGLLMAA